MGGQMRKVAQSRDVLANVLAIAVAVALLAIGLAYGIDALNRQTAEARLSASSRAIVAVNVSGVALEIPSDWLPYSSEPDSTFTDRLDLALPIKLGGATSSPMTLTLLPKTRARASSALLDSVYLQLFSTEERQGVTGLVGKPLIDNEGYAGETVWYDPIRINPFVAKCARPLGEGNDGQCLRTLVLDSGLAAILGFPESLLQDWRHFDEPLAAVFARIGAGAIVR